MDASARPANHTVAPPASLASHFRPRHIFQNSQARGARQLVNSGRGLHSRTRRAASAQDAVVGAREASRAKATSITSGTGASNPERASRASQVAARSAAAKRSAPPTIDSGSAPSGAFGGSRPPPPERAAAYGEPSPCSGLLAPVPDVLQRLASLCEVSHASVFRSPHRRRRAPIHGPERGVEAPDAGESSRERDRRHRHRRPVDERLRALNAPGEGGGLRRRAGVTEEESAQMP